MRAERGYSLAEMMIALFAFSLILSSIIFLLTRWQQTTSMTRIQRTLAVEARDAMRQIMADVREASYIYHWAEIDVSIATDAIPGYSAFDPFEIETGYKSTAGKPAIPAVTTFQFAPGANLGLISNKGGEFGLGEDDLPQRLEGRAEKAWSTLALASLAEGGMARPKYVIYFAAPEPGAIDDLHHVYRFQFKPNDDAPPDTWYPMDKTFAEQVATASLIITAESDGGGELRKVMGDKGAVRGRWQLQKLYSTVNSDKPPSRQYVRGLFHVRQLHPWSDETPISPQLVEAVVIPAQRYGNRIASFALFDRAYARNVAMPSAK